MQASSGAEDEDLAAAQRTGAAYNTSIYLMVGMPYLLLAGFTFLVWRGLRQNRASPAAAALSPAVPAARITAGQQPEEGQSSSA